MASLLVVLLVIISASPKDEPHVYPLSAAFVAEDHLIVVDVPTRTAKRMDIGSLTPEEADLSPDKKWVAFNASGPDGVSRVFLLPSAGGEPQRISVSAEGNQRFPRFLADSSGLYFSAAEKAGTGGPENPSRVFRYSMSTHKSEQLQTPGGKCEFSPVGFPNGSFAHILTSCFMNFDLSLTSNGSTKSLRQVSGPESELAVSLDAKKLLYTSKGPGGLSFYVDDLSGQPRKLATVVATDRRVQPRFVCPRDVLFLNAGKIWGLDSKSGEVKEVMTLAATPTLPNKSGGSQ